MEEAVSDLDAATIFYDSRVDALGRYFFDSLMADIESLRFFAGIHIKIHGYFCLLAKRFPYAIYYDIKDNKVIVVAVLDS